MTDRTFHFLSSLPCILVALLTGQRMIISASYRTDIPAFYGEWFMNRLAAGYCMVANPYGGKSSRVSLAREDVDGFVFWTKNLRPFAKHLPQIHERGFPFMIQFGINGYPRELEKSVIAPDASVALLRDISAQYGKRICVWRYDTVLVSSLTPADWHLRNFDSLAAALEGVTDEVVISFMHPYKKTVRALETIANSSNFTWRDPSADEKKALASQLVEIAQKHGMQLSICAQREFLVPGAVDARCIDAERLSEISRRPIRAGRQGHRKDCGCWESRDIGDYETCPHGCVYCYAVNSPSAARTRLRSHNSQSEFLFEPAAR